MKLTFLGTRANIDVKNNRHRKHSSLMVGYHGKNVMIDCGEDWIDDAREMNPDAIVITHAHPDHAFGLKNGVPSKVYLMNESWQEMETWGIEQHQIIEPDESVDIHSIQFEAFQVEHSTRAPAVGYKITAGKNSVFYAPDVVYIHKKNIALKDVSIYIGDGSTISRSFVRKRGDHLIGHTPIRTQLTWCRKEGIPKAYFTHCGSEIVKGDERTLGAKVRKMAKERGVSAQIAYDGLEIVLK